MGAGTCRPLRRLSVCTSSSGWIGGSANFQSLRASSTVGDQQFRSRYARALNPLASAERSCVRRRDAERRSIGQSLSDDFAGHLGHLFGRRSQPSRPDLTQNFLGVLFRELIHLFTK
jgi:hypothetical protein